MVVTASCSSCCVGSGVISIPALLAEGTSEQLNRVRGPLRTASRSALNSISRFFRRSLLGSPDWSKPKLAIPIACSLPLKSSCSCCRNIPACSSFKVGMSLLHRWSLSIQASLDFPDFLHLISLRVQRSRGFSQFGSRGYGSMSGLNVEVAPPLISTTSTVSI